MKLIQRFLWLISKDEKVILGRWNIDYCVNRVNQKIDLSNEDHCGTCSQYILIQKKDLKNNSWREIDEFYF